MMHMEHRLAQTQSQRLMLTQKMQQALQILQLSGLELEQYIRNELEQNPVLEMLQQEPEPPKLETSPSNGSGATSDDGAYDDHDFNFDEFVDQLTSFARTGPDLSVNPDLDERRSYYEASITQEESFTSRLLSQLRLASPDDRTYAIGERIVGEIDNRGYFVGSLESVAEEFGISVEEAGQVLELVQKFEPTGVGARDLIECLLLQIEVEFPGVPELRTLVLEHIEDLEYRRIPAIAKAMNITPERVEQLKDMLATLNPWPGHEYSTPPARYITPDVVVEKVDGVYEVSLVDAAVPKLRINDDYRRMMQRELVKKEEKKYLREKVESAKWLIRNLEQRQQTILRIASAIVDVQQEFLDKGIEQIKPLTLQEIADMVGVHEATVSRTTRGKYMQTPQGLFEMKYFFSPGLKRDSGDEQSSKSVQSMIKKIIDAEDRRKPLSDQKIANLLKQQGIQIARRTVTKYREQMGILPTTLRKSYQDA